MNSQKRDLISAGQGEPVAHAPHCPVPRAAERHEGAACLCSSETVVTDGMYLTKDEKVVVVEDGKPVRQYDARGFGWLFDLLK
jgi:hypothetical protein